jgi:hypothetical protein
VKHLKLITALAALSLTALAGCVSDTPTLSRVALKSVTTIAVGRVVERDNATPETKRARAERIVAIAVTLQGLGDDALSTLPLVMDALAPLIDKAGLTQLERMQADILVEALTVAALERIKLDSNPTFATIRLVLDDVIRAASYYLPPAEVASARNGLDRLVPADVGFCLTSYPPQCS